jgi:hypothetical protein
MRYAASYKIMPIIGLLFFSASLFAQESKSRQEILDIINSTNNMPHFGGYIERNLKPKLSASDVPIIYDFVCDKTMPFDMREILARIAASLKPDKQQIDRIINYAIQHMPEYSIPQQERGQDMAGPIVQTISILYKDTKDDKVIEPFRKLYDDSSCKSSCKVIIISKLGETRAPQNIPLFNKILHDPDSTASERQLATIALSQANSPAPKNPPFLAAPM